MVLPLEGKNYRYDTEMPAFHILISIFMPLAFMCFLTECAQQLASVHFYEQNKNLNDYFILFCRTPAERNCDKVIQPAGIFPADASRWYH
jgi:hypothetical protein